ncbi:TIR domain-containing protein [Leclercia adecarboxylata]|uniref:TIR domain-containing protein n=2 Tax=Leclercia adecarboxylata TaxID=83655 RepID=A0A9X3YB51_9ENTR|nr:TIR domain-containing protein [Leclercia adecarboxylata]MBD1402484.1 TIR domain-containing protein [Leclercia adecarboxylata]MDC6622200.1 TIR domain-containing protein [Leclercia adecarboxylata]MDC6633272.1 TIR domain-containing protein [Leclercia adecarboxylata]MDC6638804.1 TIR domain-containing protein [Leclercia adecarboxylata]MDC6649248.1 TIR domain-containing protein [Leclercia adecarboxylata]
MKRKVFYSFHFDNDVMRVQQIRNMGLLEGDEPVSPNTWEQIKRTEQGVKNWINQNLNGKSCLVVLIGSQTANRPWVKYEIQRAWEEGKAVVGVYIHRLNCPRHGYGIKGANPFDQITFKRNGQIIKPLVYEPNSNDAYTDIKNNLATWIEHAIKQ